MRAPPVRIAVAGMVTFAMVAALLGIAHVARRQEVIQLGYQLSRATEELAREQEENRRLRLEKSILTNPARIQRLAESLGMQQPGADQIRVVRVRTAKGARPRSGDPARIPPLLSAGPRLSPAR